MLKNVCPKISCSFQCCYCFCKSKIILRKWTKLFIETVLAVNLHFKHIGLNLQEKPVHHWKEREILVWKQHYNFIFDLHLFMIFAFGGHVGGNTNEPGEYMRAVHRDKE